MPFFLTVWAGISVVVLLPASVATGSSAGFAVIVIGGVVAGVLDLFTGDHK